MSLYESVESYSPLIEKSNLVEWGFWVSAGQRFSFLESAKRKDKNETFKIKKMEIYGQVKKKKTQNYSLNPNILEPVVEGNCKKIVLPSFLLTYYNKRTSEEINK